MPRPASVGGQRPGAPGRWHPLVLIPLALSTWAYLPLLRIDFYADDLLHLLNIENGGLRAFLLTPYGGHNLLARNLVFLASWEAFGLRAPFYFATVLLTHLLNVALLFGVLRRMTHGGALACFGAALWGTLPLCLGTLGWYSVYGQVLVATILLVVLHRLAGIAAADGRLPASEACLWYGLLLVGTTCFGVGIGVASVFPVVVFLLLPSAWSQPRMRMAWLLLPAVTIGLYFGFRRLYPFIATVNLAEAIQNHAAWRGVGAAPPVLAHLLTYSAAAAVLGYFLPKESPSMAAWLAASAFVAGLALLVVRGEARSRRLAAAMVVLATGMYLVIAVGRGYTYVLFKLGPAVAGRTARYHYAGSLPVVILLCLIVEQLGRLPGVRRVPGPLALACGLGIIVAGMSTVGLTVLDHQATRNYLRRTTETLPTMIRAWPPGATAYVENDRPPRAMLGAVLSPIDFPGRAAVFVLLQPSDQFEGRTVRFVEHDPGVVGSHAARPGTRLGGLLVSPDQVPARP